MSLAPIAYLLFQNVLVHDPADDQRLGRDRLVLSAGHTSLTLYIQLFLSGHRLEMGDLEALRTWGSKTPEHPECWHTRGVEITIRHSVKAWLQPSEWRWPRAGSGGCWTRRRRPGRVRSTIMSMSSSPTAT